MAWLLSKALIDRYANSPYSPEPVAESSEAACLDGELYAPSSSTSTPPACSWQGKTTAASIRFRSGMTFALSMGDRGADVLTSFLAAFPARTFQPQERGPESMASDPVCGPKWRESLAKYDPDSRSWKTRQCLLHGGSEEFSGIWPQWGIVLDGELSARAARDCSTSESACGWWPTPQRMDGTKMRLLQTVASWIGQRDACKARGVHKQYPLGIAVRIGGGESKLAQLLPRVAESESSQGECQSPEWTEWLMDWPQEWTDLRPLATDKFQAWLDSHGES